MHEAGHQFCNHFIIPEYSPIQTSRPITSSPPLLSHTGDTSPEAASYTDITAHFWILSIHFISLCAAGIYFWNWSTFPPIQIWRCDISTWYVIGVRDSGTREWQMHFFKLDLQNYRYEPQLHGAVRHGTLARSSHVWVFCLDALIIIPKHHIHNLRHTR